MIKHLRTLLNVCIGIVLPFISIAQPTANFTSNKISGCSPIVVQFSDLSTGNPTSWAWNLGNGVTSTLQNPSTTYINPGTYTVSLTVSNNSGNNLKTITNYITVYPSPVVNFTGDSLPACAPKNTQFNNLTNLGSSGSFSYLWDFGDGNTSNQTSPAHLYTSIGSYNVTLIATNSYACTKSLTKTNYIPIVQKPIANFSSPNSNACTAPANVSFTNTSANAVSYNWDFGDGGTSTQTNPSHIYSTVGTYTVRLIATNSSGCKDTLTMSAFVKIGILNSQFSSSATSVCVGTGITFTNTTTPAGSSSNWRFGDGGTSLQTSPSYLYSAAGTYSVRLISTLNNCSDTSFQNIVVYPKPTVQFATNDTIGCSVPFNVQFSNSSSNATSYLWQFGNGATSTQTNPSYAYNAFANYSVKLIATSSNGCKDSLTKPNYIKVLQPTASITTNPSGGCAPLNVGLIANISSLLPVTNYSWNFGDGSSVQSCGNCASVNHTYTTTGTFTAVLTYTTGSGCIFTVQKVVNIGTKPNASFTINPSIVCPGYPVTCTNTSTGATNYLWYDGAGSNNTFTNPSFGYKSGNYTIMLIAFNNGCPDTFTRNVTVLLPRASFTTTYQCANRLQISFVNQSLGANTYYWDFGDGNTSNVTGNTSHTYSSYGTYTVKLGVKNNTTNCTDTFYRILKLIPLTSQFNANDTTICKSETATYTTNPAYQFLNYSWSFGSTVKNTISTSITNQYNSAGIFTVKLVVTDSMGCKDSTTKVNYMRVGGATVNFTGTPIGGCVPLSVNFQDLSTANGGFNIIRTNWYYGDGNFNDYINPTHIYITPGIYNVRLVVTDANLCAVDLTKYGYINASKPIPAFSSSRTSYCIGSTVTFSNTSTGNTPNYIWHYGDGSSSSGTTGSHIYTASGAYSVKLVITDSYGCKDSITRTDYIQIIAPVLSFTLSDTSAPCPPLAVNFTNTSLDTTNSFWSFGNGSHSSVKNPSATYTYPGVYTAKLYGETTNGCRDSLAKTIRVYGPTGSFSYNPINGCTPLTISFSATTNNTSLLIWDMNNGVTQNTTSNTFSYTYTQTGKYIPKLILSDNASCLVPITGTDTINVDYLEADFSFSPSILCYSGNIQFADTVLKSLTPIAFRSWIFGDGGTSSAHNPQHTYTTPGNYTVRLIVTNTRGCIDTIQKIIIVHSLPNVTAGNNQSICQGRTIPVQLQAAGASSYTWSPSAGLSCTNCANPTALPTATTMYVVTGVDNNGCSDTGRVTITVNPKPVINLGNNRTVCLGDSIQITATGAATYTWSPSTGLSCSNCSNPYAKPNLTTIYKVAGTTALGCSDSNFITVKVNSLPVVNAGFDAIVCQGISTQLQASGAASYTWTPSTGLSCTNCANPSATPLTTTTYTVRGLDTNGCANTDQVSVKVNQLPNVNAGTNKAICVGYATTLSATGAATYSWSPSSGLSCTNCASPTASPSVTTIYAVTGTDTNGCINTDNITVTVNAIPVVIVKGKNLVCEGDTSHLIASGAIGYTWSPTTGLSCSGCPNPIAIPLITTTYKVVGSQNGCSDSANFTINVLPKPNVSAGTNKSICIGGSVNLSATGATTYVWSPAAGLSCTTCPSPVANPGSTTTYTLIGKDSIGCTNTVNVMVTVHPSPKIDAGTDTSLCEGSTVSLNVTGGQTYSWSPNINISCTNCSNPSVNPLNTITYSVEGTDINGCIDSDKITITVIKRGAVTFGNGDTICIGESFDLLASGGTGYAWIPSTGLNNDKIPNPVATPDITTNYKVIVQQGDCFTDTGNLLVVVNELPVVNAGVDRQISAGTVITLNAVGDGIVSYQWAPPTDLSCIDCPSPQASPKKSVTYTVTVANEWGCFSKDDVDINVTCDQGLIYVPNTFTPNGDGSNDRFYPQGKGVSEVKRFSVYNRWGQLLFEANNIPLNEPNLGWDGTYKNEQLKPDVFVYILHAACDNGQPIELKGDISLIR